MEVLGKVHLIGQTEVVGSAGTFKKRQIVIATDEQYVQHIPIDFVQDKCDILDKYNVGQEVKVSINIRGNEYQGKYYCNLNGWRIEKLSDAPVETAKFIPTQEAFAPVANVQEEEHDDLPF